MNSHYWRSCPMLVRCKECSQVVEVSNLIEHLLNECEQKDLYMQCPQCSEAVKLGTSETHSQSCSGEDTKRSLIVVKKCLLVELTDGCGRCPLCHSNVEIEVFGWRKHLMGDRPCPMNMRVKCQQQKQVTIKT